MTQHKKVSTPKSLPKLLTLKHLLPVIVVLTLTLPAIKPLLHPGFFTMHDDQQVVRLFQLDKALSSGQFPVRWVSDLGFGYGYPLFNFYPPLVYYLGQIYHLGLGLNFIGSIKLVFASAFLAAAAAMYYWARHHFGKLAGIAAGLFYTYAPYHAVDAYVRGSLAELFSFVWLPIILLSIDKLLDHTINTGKNPIRVNPKWSTILAISYASLMITHNLIALPFTFILGLYIALRSLTLKLPQTAMFLLFCFLPLIIGLSLSTFFWLPALAEKQYTLVNDILLTEKYSFSLHYVSPDQLWNSLWGFAGSAPGKLDGISFKIGKLHLVLSALVGISTVTSSAFFQTKKVFKQKQNSLLLISFSLLIFSGFMTTQISSFIWDNFAPLQFLQFPWRFLTFTSLFSSFLAGASIYLLQIFTKNKPLIASYFFILISLLFIPNLKLFQPQTYLDVTDSYYSSDEFTKWKISKTSFEFVPKVSTKIGENSGVTQVDINPDQIAKTPFKVISGNPKVKLTKNFADSTQLQVTSDTNSTIQINTFNFPGWKAFLDNQEIAIIDDNPLKLITVNIPPGKHTLSVSFTNTLVRSFGNVVSLLSILVLVLLNSPKPQKALIIPT